MRKKLFFGILIAASMTLMSSTCSSDDDNNNSNVNVEELTNITTSGTWYISSYVDDGNEETYHFTNFTFNFDSSGTVTAINGETNITGMWSISNDSSSDDDDGSSSDEDFNLFFDVSESSHFEDLNDDWDIIEYNDNIISLRDVSGGDGSVDTLVFTKN